MRFGYFNQENPIFTKRAISLGKWLCLLSLLLPLLNFIGRSLEIHYLSKIHGDLPSMTPNASFGLIIFSLSIYFMLLKKKWKFGFLIPGISVFSALIGLLTMTEYIFRVDLGIDSFSERPAFLTGLNLFLLGLSILLAYLKKGRQLFQHLLLVIMSICLLVITGYLFSSRDFHGFPIFRGASPMALNTAMAFILLSIALLCVDPKKGFMNLLTSETQSGHFARGMCLAILTVPPALGFITHIATLMGLITITFQVSLFMLLLITFWFIITWRLTKKGEQNEIEIFLLTERLKLVLDKASDGIFTADLDGNYLDVNEAGCKLLGFSRDEIVGKNIRHFLPEYEFQKLNKKKQQIKEREVQLTEWQMKTKSGETIPVEVSDTLLQDGRWVGIVRDIKERITYTRNLQNSEKKFRGLLEAAQDAVVIVNSHGEINFVNHQVLNWFGYEEGELTGKPIEVLIPDRYSKKHVSLRNGYLENPIARPMGRDLDLFGKRKDGSEFPVNVALSPSESSEGRIVTAVIRDITENKKHEREINFISQIGSKLTETLDVDLILNHAAELVVPDLCDCCVIRSMDKDGQFRATKIVHKYPEKIALMEEYSKAIESSPEVQNTINELIMKGDSFVSMGGIRSGVVSLKPEVQKLVEKTRIHSFIIVPLIAKDSITGTMSFVLDDSHRSFELTDIKFFENIAHRICLSLENAKLYKDAKQAIKMREDVLSIVSHDLKNPLAYITLKTQLLNKNKNEFDEKINQFTKSISRATSQMQTLINDLLDFAKLESGTMVLDIESHHVQHLISPLIDIVTTQSAEKNISFDIKIDPDVSDIRCDADRIRQVLSNLLGNALKFTQNGGTLTLEIKKGMDHTLFKVIDNGQGINPDYLEKIFDRFWQVEKTKKQGSGLGLAICKSIVQNHRGKIWAESDEGKGSRFIFTLPDAQLHDVLS